MSDFDQAIQEHICIYKEGIQDKYYQGAKWAWQHQQAKIEKLENELSTTKQVLGNVIDMEVAKVDNLKTQLNNMEACYIEKKKQVEACSALVGQWREKRMGGCSDYARGGLHSRQDCTDDLEKALRGAND